MDLSLERRSHRRFVYEAEIAHDLLAHNNIYKGKLYNFSRGGLYFESDQPIFPGEEVFIKFKDQPDSSNDDMMSQLPFGVEIVWQNDLPDSFFRFGYGAHYLDINDSLVTTIKIPELEQENLQDKNLAAEKDPREYPRRQYHQSLLLQYQRKSYSGEFKDISKGGVFIKTDIKFTVGKKIRIVIPGSKIRQHLKLRGLIVRINTEGFGVKFDRSPGLVFVEDLKRRTGLDRRTLVNRRD